MARLWRKARRGMAAAGAMAAAAALLVAVVMSPGIAAPGEMVQFSAALGHPPSAAAQAREEYAALRWACGACGA